MWPKFGVLLQMNTCKCCITNFYTMFINVVSSQKILVLYLDNTSILVYIWCKMAMQQQYMLYTKLKFKRLSYHYLRR